MWQSVWRDAPDVNPGTLRPTPNRLVLKCTHRCLALAEESGRTKVFAARFEERRQTCPDNDESASRQALRPTCRHERSTEARPMRGALPHPEPERGLAALPA